MTKVYIVQTPQTTWEAESRIESVGGAPLTEAGAKAVEATAAQLADQSIADIYTATGEAEVQTARILSKALGLKVRKNRNLRELDYGLWQGLKLDEIKRRQPKVFRQWREQPISVRPPGGETIREAQWRLIGALGRIVKRRKNGPALFVLRPVAAALVRCAFEIGQIESLWNYADERFTWCAYDLDAQLLERAAQTAPRQ